MSNPALPIISQQQVYIIENSKILNRETRIAILSIVMMEIGSSVIIASSGKNEINIDLNAVAKINEDIITHIYNIVLTRREALNKPVSQKII